MTGLVEGYESVRYRIEQLISGRERTVAMAGIATVAGVLLLLVVVFAGLLLLLLLLLHLFQQGEVFTGIGHIRLQGKGFLVCCYRLINFPGFCQGVAVWR